jgi:epoxyqueuosine reductase
MNELPPSRANSVAATLTPSRVRKLARAAGFSEAGLVALPHANEGEDGQRFAEWIAAGHAGSMHYLERRDEQGKLLRAATHIPFPWARSVIVCLASYNSAPPRSTAAHPDGAGWIARYAWSSRVDGQGQRRPSDYHKVLKKRLEKLEALLRAEDPEKEIEARGFVDTGPVLERSMARAAGLGWTGKNTCLIHPKLGSFVFLSVLLTSLEVVREATMTLTPDHCGSCRRCLDACPTNALLAPHQMDARRCIAYLTIEQKGPLDDALLSGVGRQIFGCDICQDVCTWNRKAVLSADDELAPREELVNPDLEELASLTEAEFEQKFNGAPVRRAGYFGLLRNVAVAMGNSGAARFQPQLETWARAEDAGLAAAARWALERLTLSLK